MRRSLVFVALVSVVLIGGAAHSAGATGTAPTFNQNLLLPNSGSAAEPSIRVDSHGTPFVIAPTGVPAGCKAWRVGHDGSSAAFLGFPDSTLGGGDCDWAIGPQETGGTGDDLAYSSLSLANITTGKSDDNGATFTPPNVFSQQIAGDDRMWMAADPKLNSSGNGTIYMTYHDVTVGEIELGVSTDGGFKYVQNSPLINPLDVPATQCCAAGSNELGNIVAHRDASGLKLYSIFTTQDGSTGSSANNRVYEAVGTVTYPTSDLAPVVSWRDYEIYHGPAGAQYNKIFPVTAVDAAGHVYAVWTDAGHIYFKRDSDGTHWDAAALPTTLDAPGHNTALMPWMAAGGDGMVDVVWYAASGGAAGNNDDPANQWVVWMAQTLDGGTTWTGAQASDHVIHTGSICIDGLACDTSQPPRDRTLLDFFQVDIDPTSGAADIAYADDHATSGDAVVYFTRQCTGNSATTGAALTNDCVVPPPPAALPQGTTCPGPQVVDAPGDAPNSYPGGDGSNIDSLDVTNASFAPGASGQLNVTLTLKSLNASTPPAVNLPAGLWRVAWTYGGTTYAVELDSNGNDATASYTVGTLDSAGNYTPSSATVGGTYTPGANGTIVWKVPLSAIGGPPASATLTSPWAETHGAIEVAGGGVFYTAPADRAPNTGFGSDANVGGCTSGTTTGGTASSTTSGGGSSGGSGSSSGTAGSAGGAQPTTTVTKRAPTTTAAPASTAPTGGVAGVEKTKRMRTVRAHGLVGVGRLGTASFTIAAHTLTYLDRTHRIALRATIRTLTFGASSARILGVGILNGKRVRFAALAVDHGRTGDVFRIDWNGGLSRGGLVRKGGITVT